MFLHDKNIIKDICVRETLSTRIFENIESAKISPHKLRKEMVRENNLPNLDIKEVEILNKSDVPENIKKGMKKSFE